MAEQDFITDVMYDFERWLRQCVVVYRMQDAELVVLMDKSGKPVNINDATKLMEYIEFKTKPKNWAGWKNAVDAYLDTLK